MQTKLRDYQQDLINRIYHQWGLHHRVMAQLPTGGGKSVIFGAITSEFARRGKRVLVMAHRDELIVQGANHLKNWTDVEVGIIKYLYPFDINAPIQFASVQSLFTRINKIGEYDLIIIDECFPAGTLVDGKPIELLQIGDFVNSFNESTGEIEAKPIVRLFKKLSNSKVTVIAGQSKIECTEEHPFYTKRGWIPANQLTTEDFLYVSKLPTLSEEFQAAKQSIIGNHGENQPQICFRQNEYQQSNEQIGISNKDVQYPQKNGTQATYTGREWEKCIGSTTNAFRCTDEGFERLGNGVDRQDQSEKGEWLSISLQNRYCKPVAKNSSGDRWVLTHSDCTARAGCKKNQSLEWVSVESVEIYQQTGDGKPGERYVYNIEVLDNHNYFVEDILVHNCHHATATSYQQVLDRYPDAQVLGLTATPCRTNGKGFEDVFEVLECGITTEELIKQGHLSPYKIFAGEKKMKTDGVKTKEGDYNLSDLAAVNNITEIAGNLVENYQKHVIDGSCMVFAINVEHSEAIAKAYREAGITAEHLDAKTEKRYRKYCLELFREGTLKVITNVGLFGEGVDVPQLNAIQVARPTKSLALYLQMAGRVLRRSPDKEYGIILDHTDNLKIHGFPDDPRAWSLFPKPKKEVSAGEGRSKSAPAKEITQIIETSEELQEQIRNQAIADAWQVREDKLAKIPDELWRHNLRSLLTTQVDRGYKPAWLCYRLADMNAPYHIWDALGQLLNYKPGWAKYKWQEMQQKQAA